MAETRDITVISKVDIAGVGVSAINMDIAISYLAERIGNRIPSIVCVRDAHGVIACRRDPKLRDIHEEAELVTPDGMPLVWFCRRMGQSHVGRVYGPDLLLAACKNLHEAKAQHYFYGGAEGIADKLASALEARFPGLGVAGTHCPPFRDLSDSELEAVCAEINAAKPDIIWVGLSTPKQEFWMSRVRPLLDAPVLIGIGAAFDFHSGTKPQAPKWMQRNGLEWFFRMASEPRRLGPRYLKTVPLFAYLMARQLILHKFSRRALPK